jgi:hypothetical protein
MTARPVAPVIPAASCGHLREGRPGAGRPMPLASPPGRPDVVYGFGRIDASGRVADRTITNALRRRCGLRDGDHVLLAAVPGEDLLAAYSFAVVDQAMRAHVRFRRGEGGLP